MKKSILLSAALLAFLVPAKAQFSFGIQGSQFRSWSSGYSNSSNGDGPSKAGGFGVSVPVYYKMGKHFSVGIEPGVAQRSGSNSSKYIDFFCCFGDCTFDIFHPSSTINANYFILPVMTMFSVPLAGERLGFFLKSGVGPSWMNSAYVETEQNDPFMVPENTPAQVDFSKENFNRLDWGMYSGAGIDFFTGRGNLRLCADSYMGFREIREFQHQNKFRSMGLSLGYHIALR